MASDILSKSNEILYTHNDESKWGDRFFKAALELGYNAQLFNTPQEIPDNSKVFLRLDQRKGQRSLCKFIAEGLFKKGCITIPTYVESRLYDDKVAQFPVLCRWLPQTVICRTADNAQLIAGAMEYPFISKSACGASSKGVRLINNNREALAEIEKVFSAEGMYAGMYDRRQQGYVYWQKFIPQNPCDYRVIICGPYIFGIIRRNRKDVPFASGSGDSVPFTAENMATDSKVLKAMKFCNQIANIIKTNWLAFDVVFDEKGTTPYLLEISSSWSPWIYTNCPTWMRQQAWMHQQEGFEACNKYTGADMFKMAVEILVGMKG